MPITTDKLCIWHIPRTGGTWLYSAMMRAGIPVQRDPSYIHATRDEYHGVHEFHAVIVRDPVDWYASVWRWMRKYGPRSPLLEWFPRLHPTENWKEDKALVDFEYFLVQNVGSYSRMLERFPWYATRLTTNRLSADAICWLESVGIEFDREKFRTTKPDNMSEEPYPNITPELRSMICVSEVGYR